MVQAAAHLMGNTGTFRLAWHVRLFSFRKFIVNFFEPCQLWGSKATPNNLGYGNTYPALSAQWLEWPYSRPNSLLPGAVHTAENTSHNLCHAKCALSIVMCETTP